MENKVISLISLVLLTLNLNAQSYVKASGDSINPRIYASAGVFNPSLTTSLRIDTQKGLGTEISLEDDLNFENQMAVIYAQVIVRAKKRSQFMFSYTNINRTSNLTIDKDLTIGDTTFFAGASAAFKFDVNYYAFTWRYSFFNRATWNAGLSFGLRAAQFGFKVDANVNGDEYGTNDRITAPAVLLGIHGSGYLTPRFLGRYSFEIFDVQFEGIDMVVLETRASLEYFIIENVGLGVAYSTSSYKVDDFPISNNLDGRVLFEFSGLNLYLSARF